MVPGDGVDQLGVEAAHQHVEVGRGRDVWPGLLPGCCLPVQAPLVDQPGDGVDVVVLGELRDVLRVQDVVVVLPGPVLVKVDPPVEAPLDVEEDIGPVIKELADPLVDPVLQGADCGAVWWVHPVAGESHVSHHL